MKKLIILFGILATVSVFAGWLIDGKPATTTNTVYVVSEPEVHTDSYTNLVWKSVYSNGWMWLIAYTNTPSI